jgi:hypothetical protein
VALLALFDRPPAIRWKFIEFGVPLATVVR